MVFITNTTNGAIALFDDMDWGSGNHFLKIEMDATGGTNYAMIGTTQMMSVPYALYAKSAGIDSTMLATMLANDSSVSQNIYLQCVDMGVSLLCGGLGLNPSATLNSNNYNYPINYDNSIVGNYISVPHWRKFEIIGLGSDYIAGSDLMIRHHSYSNHNGTSYYNSSFVTPEVINGRVYFYMHAVNLSSGSCNTTSDIGLSIPLSNSLEIEYYASSGGGGFSLYRKSYFSIFYESTGSFKNTNIIFDK